MSNNCNASPGGNSSFLGLCYVSQGAAKAACFPGNMESKARTEPGRKGLHQPDLNLQNLRKELLQIWQCSNHSDFSCPICLQTATFPVETNCGHLFCGACLITYWKHSPWLAAITCPLCRQKVVILDNISCEKQQDKPSKQIVHDIRDYNKRFAGQPRHFFFQSPRRWERVNPGPSLLFYPLLPSGRAPELTAPRTLTPSRFRERLSRQTQHPRDRPPPPGGARAPLPPKEPPPAGAAPQPPGPNSPPSARRVGIVRLAGRSTRGIMKRSEGAGNRGRVGNSAQGASIAWQVRTGEPVPSAAGGVGWQGLR
ncbi:uncharacterized protein LOC102092395 isoform X3 [Columba livia]|uniref:uncharacterized protein LOC102092395 isoform X3 n=1 Tax=Columba livia TaxID=8932 RepID=UPI0031BB67B7